MRGSCSCSWALTSCGAYEQDERCLLHCGWRGLVAGDGRARKQIALTPKSKVCGRGSVAYDVANSYRAEEVPKLQPPAAREGRSKRKAVSATVSSHHLGIIREEGVGGTRHVPAEDDRGSPATRRRAREGPTHMQAGTGPVGQKDQPDFVWTSERQRDRDELRAPNVWWAA